MKLETIQDVISEVNDFYGHGSDLKPCEVLESMKISRLDRIATALEKMEDHLDMISNNVVEVSIRNNPLDECLSRSRYGAALCITGNVTNLL